jgi:hypothetical protein
MTSSDSAQNGDPAQKGSSSGGPDLFKTYEAIWRNMERENNLINYRIQWSIVLSGGILATEGILVAATRVVSGDISRAGLYLLMLMLSCLAIFFSWKAQEAVAAALNQLEYLKDQYKSFNTPEGYSVFEMVYRLPRPFGDPHDHHKGNIAASTFPRTIIIIWSVYAVVQAAAVIIYGNAGVESRFPAVNPAVSAPAKGEEPAARPSTSPAPPANPGRTR